MYSAFSSMKRFKNTEQICGGKLLIVHIGKTIGKNHEIANNRGKSYNMVKNSLLEFMKKKWSMTKN